MRRAMIVLMLVCLSMATGCERAPKTAVKEPPPQPYASPAEGIELRQFGKMASLMWQGEGSAVTSLQRLPFEVRMRGYVKGTPVRVALGREESLFAPLDFDVPLAKVPFFAPATGMARSAGPEGAGELRIDASAHNYFVDDRLTYVSGAAYFVVSRFSEGSETWEVQQQKGPLYMAIHIDGNRDSIINHGELLRVKLIL